MIKAILNIINFSIVLIFFLISTNLLSANINNTTDRIYKDKLVCRITTTPNSKPRLKELDFVRAGDNIGYADLNQDGVPEIVLGASDSWYSTKDLNNKNHKYHRLAKFYKGNELRSRKAHQFSFYSTDPNFEVPKGTKFFARTIISNDFNGDNKDDLIFVNQGPDYAPHVPYQNEILLSNEIGYETFYLPGEKSLFHGGTAGDIDNDGDIDVVVTPGPKNEIIAYLNNGKGKFKTKKILKNVGRNYTVKLWDIDKDGALDLIIDGHTEPLKVFWGNNKVQFKSSTTIKNLPNYWTMQDAVFVENEDETISIVTLSSIAFNEEIKAPYQGFSIDNIKLKKRIEVSKNNIDQLGFPTKDIAPYFPFFSKCDLLNDGDWDLVVEIIGENRLLNIGMATWMYLDKIIWENKNGSFERIILEDPYYIFEKKYTANVNQLAKSIGVSLEKYMAQQIYYPTNDKKDWTTYKLPPYKSNYVPKPWAAMNNEEKAITSKPHLIEDLILLNKPIEKPKKSQSKINDPDEVSEKVKKILKQIKSGKDKITLEKNDTLSDEIIESQSKRNDPDNVSDKVKQILKKIKNKANN